MSDTERTQHMTDAEVLEDLRAQRRAHAPQRDPHQDVAAFIAILLLIAVVVLVIFLPDLLHIPGNLLCYAYNCQ